MADGKDRPTIVVESAQSLPAPGKAGLLITDNDDGTARLQIDGQGVTVSLAAAAAQRLAGTRTAIRVTAVDQTAHGQSRAELEILNPAGGEGGPHS